LNKIFTSVKTKQKMFASQLKRFCGVALKPHSVRSLSFFSNIFSRKVEPAPERPFEEVNALLREKIMVDPEIKLYLLQIEMIFAEHKVNPRLLKQTDEERVYDVMLDDRLKALMYKIKERGIELTSAAEWEMISNVIQKQQIDIMDLYNEAEQEELVKIRLENDQVAAEQQPQDKAEAKKEETEKEKSAEKV
jgi:hypothetical protein